MKIIEDQAIFHLDGETVSKVRIHGIIVERYDSSPTIERPFSSLLLDDTTNTISLKLWSSLDHEEQQSERSLLLDGIEVGQIIDVIGRVREYEDEKYVVPEAISGDLSLDWEIHRRAKLLEKDFEEKGIADEQSLFTSEKEDEVAQKAKLVLSVMSDNLEQNTIDNLVIKLGMQKDEVVDLIRYLQIEGIVISPKPGMFTKLSGM
ncbi:MAG: hypothetical protein ACXAD7_12100 [Candidatus Kariarchaeaceae archaeon]|jgi:RPA family protein